MLDMKAETFLCVCRHMNFTRASEELHITQPAVTQQVHSLESYYGARLFKYANRTLTLTKQGAYLRSCLEAMSHDTQRIRDGLRDSEAAPTLNIGTTMSAGDYILPDYFARFMKADPRIHLVVTRLDTRDILDLLNSGKLDFAFVEGYVRRDIYAVTELSRDEIIMVCSANSDAVNAREIGELLPYPLLLREEGSGTREIFTGYLKENQLTAESFEKYSVFNSPAMIKKLLLAGCGISALYRSVVSDSLSDGSLCEIKLDGFPLRHSYSAVWRRESIYADYYEKLICEMKDMKDAADGQHDET